MTSPTLSRRPADEPLLDRISAVAYGAYQTAVVRIAIAAIWLAVLLREFPNRHGIWGPDAPWGFDQAGRSLAESGGFSFFGWHAGTAWFELCYAVALLATACVLLGWRTRPMSILFALSVMSFQHRNEYVLNAGENIIRITAIYLIFTRCARVWSLDARNRRRRLDGEDHTGTVLWVLFGAALGAVSYLGYPTLTWSVLLWAAWVLYGGLWYLHRSAGPALRRTVGRITNVVHNGTLVLIMAQVCLIYAAAGWYKIQGSLWQDGTAVYWSMNIGWLSPWPELSELLTGNSGIVLLLTYATVLVQVAFPFSLLNRRVKNVMLAVLIMEHLGIGLLMGLPFFSMAMIAIDLIFLPTLLLRLDRAELRVLRVAGWPWGWGAGLAVGGGAKCGGLWVRRCLPPWPPLSWRHSSRPVWSRGNRQTDRVTSRRRRSASPGRTVPVVR
jgi:uncharacterized membrane protein YphA (DoxX/SURF4 family)